MVDRYFDWVDRTFQNKAVRSLFSAAAMSMIAMLFIVVALLVAVCAGTFIYLLWKAYWLIGALAGLGFIIFVMAFFMELGYN